MNPFSLDLWTPVGTAVLCSVIIGLERQLRGKPVGVRTSCLITLSTAIFVLLGSGAAGKPGEGVQQIADPTRVIGQIVTGVGFLGAGVILARGKKIMGVTTAAVIWMLAAIGATIGTGNHLAAIAISVVTVIILTGITFLESAWQWLRRGVHSEEGDE